MWRASSSDVAMFVAPVRSEWASGIWNHGTLLKCLFALLPTDPVAHIPAQGRSFHLNVCPLAVPIYYSPVTYIFLHSHQPILPPSTA